MAKLSPLLAVLLVVLLATPSETRNTVYPQSDLATCLNLAGVRNFTVQSSAATSPYSRLLSFSIQNLRFSRASLPKPAAIILPSTLLHLRSTVVCVRRASLTVRLRSGGHSYEGLSYLARQRTAYAIIDLMNLDRVRVDPASHSAWAESGATLGQIYYSIAKSTESWSNSSLAFSAGSCPTVGSGGHIAGGGFGLLSRKFGLAADNVVDAILIDSAGRVMTRDSMGEDVFWAIRGGGGGGWGAVYAWKVRLRPVPKRVTCFIINRSGSTRRVAELVHKWQRVGPGLPDEFYLSCFVGAGLNGPNRTGLSATFKGFFLGPAHEVVRIMDRWFPELGLGESDTTEMSWIESAVYFAGLDAVRLVSDLSDRKLHAKTFFKAKSDYVRTPISLLDLISALDLLSKEPKAYLILDPYGGAMEKIKSDHLPFPHRNGNLYAIQYLVEWTSDDDHKSLKYIDWIRDFYEYMGQFVSKSPRAAYVNYLDLDLGTIGSTNKSGVYSDAVAEAKTWGERYFLGNYDRLVRAKTSIDPDNVFCNDQSIPPAAIGHSVM